MLKEIKIDLLYQRLIDGPPPRLGDPYKNACRGDKDTIEAWRDTWVKNYQAAKDHFGELKSKTIGSLYGINRQRPCIVVGSGPSLADALPTLKANSESDNPVMVVSCLHNFGLFEDHGFHADYYLSLDSGKIVLDDIAEGREAVPDYYWEKTKGKTLLAYASSDPGLWANWQGEVMLFNALIPDAEIMGKKKEIENFTHYISSGGNALGACLYVAKALMCSDPIMFVGADFCFGYDNTFHSYKTHYDNVGQYIMWRDVYGIPRKTWASYLNFKFWFDDRACNVPGNYINCSGGLLGAYDEGNIKQFQYMPLNKALEPYVSHDVLYLEKVDGTGKRIAGEKEPFKTRDYWDNPNYNVDVTFF